MGVLCGKKLIMNEQKPCTLFIYSRHMFSYVPYKTIDLKNHKIFEEKISMQFWFKNSKGSKREACFFAMFDQIIEFNFEKETYSTFYQFKQPLSRQP